MKPFISCLFLGLVVALAGCRMHPMGHSQSEWEAMSPAQQLAAQEQQAEINRQQAIVNEQRRQQQEALARQQQHEQLIRERMAQDQLAMAYRFARYGDIVTVTIQGGMVAINGRHQPYEPVRFDLVRGETKQVEFVQQGRASARNLITVRLSDDGHTFFFDERARDRVKLLSDGWEQGKTYGPLDVRDEASQSVASAIHITVKFKAAPGSTPRPPSRRP